MAVRITRAVLADWAADMHEMGLRRLPLRFADPAVEEAFREDYFTRSLTQMRIALLMAMLLIGVFGIVDVLYFPWPTARWLLVLRFPASWTAFLAALALSYSPRARQLIQPVLGVVIVWVGLCIVAMIGVGGPQAGPYYVGLIMCFIFGYTFVKARLVPASVAGWTLLLLYVPLAIWVFQLPPAGPLISSLFMIAANLTCMATCYSIEFRTRSEFFLRFSLAAAQSELVERERLTTLGKLAGAMGHELRNPLGVISNAVYFLQNAPQPAAETQDEYLDIVTTQVHVAGRIISDLLAYASAKAPEPAVWPVETLLRTALDRCPPPPNVTGRMELDGKLPPVWVDGEQVMAALVRLLENAYQAMPAGGELSLQAGRSDARVALAVADTGHGIPPESLAQIFEPLFSTRLRGIGLGLACARRWVEQNGGEIRVQSQVDQGSTFTLLLPADDGRPEN